MARTLVIGGTLFIGRAMVERLLERGDDVVLMHRGQGTPFGDRVREIRCDRNDVAAVQAALAGQPFDFVFDNVYDWERGTSAAQVAAAARAVASPALRRYVFTSSVAAYGGGMEHDERDPLAPASHPDDYVRHKAESERILFRLHRDEGLPVTTLRPAFVYGPGNPFDREAWFWDRILAGRPVIVPEDGARLMQFVYVQDVAEAALRAAGREASNGLAYNLGCDPPVSQVEWLRILARAAGESPRLVHVPRARIEAAGGGLIAPPLYFGTYLDLPPLTIRTTRIREELGLAPTPLERGFAETFAWYRQQERPVPDYAWEDRLISSATSAKLP